MSLWVGGPVLDSGISTLTLTTYNHKDLIGDSEVLVGHELGGTLFNPLSVAMKWINPPKEIQVTTDTMQSLHS